jgi:hypothetical protein
MANLLQKTLSLLTGNPVKDKSILKKLTNRELIELEAQIGGSLFGPIPNGHRREFFCLDENTWVWHEEWIDADNERHVSSTRYEIHSNGILKAQDGRVYKFIEGDELRNLVLSMRLYYEAVSRDIYRRDPYTGRKIVTSTPDIM